MSRAFAAACPRAVHLLTDDFWRSIVSGAIPPYLPESDSQNRVVMRVIVKAATTFAAGGYTTIVDGVIGPWMLYHFLLARGPRMHYLVLRPARDETIRRAQARGTNALTAAGPLGAMWDQFAALGAWERHAIDTTHQDRAATLTTLQAAVASDKYLL
jgi:hypothetical protein